VRARWVGTEDGQGQDALEGRKVTPPDGGGASLSGWPVPREGEADDVGDELHKLQGQKQGQGGGQGQGMGGVGGPKKR